MKEKEIQSNSKDPQDKKLSLSETNAFNLKINNLEKAMKEMKLEILQDLSQLQKSEKDLRA
jgi:hypothetical protein